MTDPLAESTAPDALAALTAAGVSLWLDDLNRQRLRTGNLAALIADKHVTGVTSNPTIFAAALADGEEYAAQVKELAARDADVDSVVRTLTTDDVRNACDLFAPVNAATDGVDGRVSIEVEPGLASDTAGTIAQAQELAKIVDRPNLLVKIPATAEGIPAIAATLAGGHQRERDADLLPGALRRGDRRLLLRAGAGQGERPRHLETGFRRLVLRVQGGHRDRQAAERHRHPGGIGAAGQGRDRERPAGLPALRAEVRHRPLGRAGGGRRAPAAPTLGLHRRQGPGLRRHPVRRRARGRRTP